MYVHKRSSTCYIEPMSESIFIFVDLNLYILLSGRYFRRNQKNQWKQKSGKLYFTSLVFTIRYVLETESFRCLGSECDILWWSLMIFLRWEAATILCFQNSIKFPIIGKFETIFVKSVTQFIKIANVWRYINFAN